MSFTTLVIALVGLALLRPALRLVAAAVAGKSIGRIALTRQADQIHLVEASTLAWKDPAAAEALREPLLLLGYEPAGNYTVKEMPGLVMRLMVHARERVTAAIYEHPQAGTWLELFARHADGTGFTVTSSIDRGLEQRPGFPVVHLPGVGASDLHARYLAQRPAKERVAVESGQAVARFQQAYAESMAWRKQHGVSRAEVARIAVTGVPKNSVRVKKAA